MAEQRKVVTQSPENSETPLADVHSWVTPTRLFFVRNHFAVPDLDVASWRLSVGGCVARPLVLTWDELDAMPQRTLLATLECAGNGRSFLSQKVPGVQWSAGAVAHAEWSGVALRDVLEMAGLDDQSVEIVFEGADVGTEADHPEPMHFARGLPPAKALHRDTLLALRMNGEPLTPSHGFPLRLLAPGWYGVASVKWLTRIEAVRVPFRGYFQTVKYTVKRERAGDTVKHKRAGDTVKRERAGDTVKRKRAGDTVKRKRAGDTVKRERAGDTVKRKRAGDTVKRKRAGDTVKRKRAGDTVKRERAGDTVKRERAGDTVKRERAGDTVKRERAGDTVKRERAGDTVKRERAGDTVKRERAGDTVKRERAGDTVKRERAGDTVKRERAGDTVKRERAGDTVKRERAGDTVKRERAGDTVKRERAGDTVKRERAGDTVKRERAGDTVKRERTGDTVKRERAGDTVKRERAGDHETVPLQDMAVKSEIVRPFAGEALPLGKQRVFGLAWAGEEPVAKVELSTDGGKSWHETELLGPWAPYSWMMWEYLWNARDAGSYELLSRATTISGRTQPTDYDSLNCGYMIHFSRPISVRVESRAGKDAATGDADVLRYDMNAFAEANARRPLDVDLEFSLGAGI